MNSYIMGKKSTTNNIISEYLSYDSHHQFKAENSPRDNNMDKKQNKNFIRQGSLNSNYSYSMASENDYDTLKNMNANMYSSSHLGTSLNFSVNQSDDDNASIDINFDFKSSKSNNSNLNGLNNLMKSYQQQLIMNPPSTPRKKDDSVENSKYNSINLEDLEHNEDDSDSLIEEIKGVSIDDFKIITNIGKGGFSTVDFGKKKNTGDFYAIKSVCLSSIVNIYNNFKKSKKSLDLLNKEAKILSEVCHDNLVRCYYIFSDDINFYFVMEFVGGGDLFHLMSTYNLSPAVIKQLLAEMLLALDYIHGKHIYHRDIKPENILIDKNVIILIYIILYNVMYI